MKKTVVPTVGKLIDIYKRHGHSPYCELRPKGRRNCDYLCRRLEEDWRRRRLSSIKANTLIVQFKRWSSNGQHIPMASSLISMLRQLVGFGFIFLEDRQCDRLRNLMGEMKFERGKARTEIVTPAQAIAIRAEAHRVGRPSIALGQAGMTDFGWRQTDMIGSYDPRGKEDTSDIVVARWGEWLHGLRFEEIDDDLVVRHITSKKQKLSEVPLVYAPMMLQELRLRFCPNGEPLTRDRMPTGGPLVVNEITGVPYSERQWRYEWRKIARAAGIPDKVQNRDSRAGRATHALSIGVPLNRMRQMLGHSNAKTTEIYLRNPAAETAEAMKQIAASA